MDILFLSHCVPNPPDKGEKIRAYHELNRLASRYRVHLACFARNSCELEDAHKLRDRCASVFVEPLPAARGLCRAGVNFLMGRSLTAAFYGSRRMRRYAASRQVDISVAYSSVMAPYAPAGIPLLLDMVDVDSEKWLQYGQVRRPGALYTTEGNRLRGLEIEMSRRASATFLATWNEAHLLRSFAPDAAVHCMENGVDFDYFDPSEAAALPALRGRRFVTLIGAMDYFPNADGACWFASSVLPALRQKQPDLEFFVVGRNPTPAVKRLSREPGITVTGTVEDVRPYLAAAQAVVAPLRIARGIQNKVLEALAMGKQVYASSAVCKTFGPELPTGVVPCGSEQEYLRLLENGNGAAHSPLGIRGDARRRFSWAANLDGVVSEVEAICDAAPAAIPMNRFSRAQ